MTTGKTRTLYLLTLLLAGLFATTTSLHPPLQRITYAPVPNDPLGHFQGNGIPVGISWTGDGQRIPNPSFETGSISPWIQTQYNAAAGSTATITTPGYDGTKSAQLTLLSGNVTFNSYLYILSDFSQQPVGFSSGLRFRAAALVQQLTGTSQYDRVETSIALTTSTGNLRSIHYIFASATSAPANSTADEYIVVGTSPTGQWVAIDRSVAADAAGGFPNDYPSFDSVSQVTLTEFAQTVPGAPNRDPHIRFWDTVGNSVWQSGESVIYDTNLDGKYETGEPSIGGCTDGTGSPIICSLAPPDGTSLATDPKIKFVDPDGNDVWDPGEPIVWDQFNTNIVNYYDTIIIGPKPDAGTLLMKIIQNHTGSLFDRIELYSNTAGADWIKNGGFESGLTAWYENSSFTTSTTTFVSGTHSARGSITDSSIEMAQSIDGRPVIDSSTIFKASANIATMTGTTASSIVDIWLGLVDANYNPVSLYYVYKTGDGSLPRNNTDTIYRKAGNFGTLNQWLSVNASLLQQTLAFNSLGYTPPYSVEVVVVEVRAQPSTSTTAYFDEISIHRSSHTGTLPSTFYAVDGLNTTYAYVTQAIPQGSFHVEIPGGETILNITSPEGTLLRTSEYSTNLLTSCTISPCLTRPRAVDVPDTTILNHSPNGNWRVFTTSTNSLANVYAEHPTTHNQAPSINVGSTVNLVSQSKDPLGQPLAGVTANFTLWNTNTGMQSGFWTGTTNTNGWYNVSSITLPLAGSTPGIYSLQAAVYSTYPGIRTFQISVRYTVAVTLAISASQISQGQTATISGNVTLTGTSTPGQGVNVTIYYRQAGNSQWTPLGTVKTDASGKFSFTWNPPQGQYEVKASTGDTQTTPTDSNREQLIVGPPTFPWTLVMAIIAAVVVGAFALLVLWRRKKNSLPSPAQPAQPPQPTQ